MSPRPKKDITPPAAAASSAAAREAWSLMNDLVLDAKRRRAVSEPLGISFGRARALRRIARNPLSMGELAGALGIDPPNATAVVDELEAMKLARRRPHPSDRRAKIVEPTRKGKELAKRADEILATPPAGLQGLNNDDLKTLKRILAQVSDVH